MNRIIIIMQLSELPKDYLALLTKLSQLVRYYSMGKKLEKFNLVKEKVKSKIKQITDALQEYDQYQFIKEDVQRKIDSTFMEAVYISSKKSSSNVSRQNSDLSKQSSGNINSSNSNNVNSDKLISDKVSVQGSIKKAVSQTYQQQKPKPKPIKAEKPKQASFQQQVKTPLSPEKKQTQKSNQTQPKIQKTLEKKVEKVITSVAEILTPSQNYQIKSLSKGTSNDFSCLNSDILEGKGVQTMKHLQKIELESISSISGDNAKQSPTHSFMGMLEQQNDNMIETPGTLNKKSQSDSIGMSEQDNLSEQQQKFSEGSYCQQMQDSLIKFFTENREKLNFDLVFNNELFQHMEKQLDNFVYLFGINKPDSKKITKLYACTIMKFLDGELYRSQDKFEKQTRDFSNNIRLPLGLIFKGDGESAITPQHIKFLLNFHSPFPIILVVKNDAAEQGVLCSFNDSIIERIRITPKKQLGQLSDELRKNIFSLAYREQHYPKDKNKVMTKFLSRVIPNLAQQAPNAIAISGNQCIRQQKHCFIYKLHTKFLIMTKTDFNIYFANNNLINARMSFKDKEFQAFKREVIEGQSKIPIILSVNVGKQTSTIKRQFFELLLQSKPKRDPFFFINFASLTVKKTVVATLQPDITMEMIRSTEPIQYKNFEKDTILTCCVHVITKSNFKQFQQTEGKSDLIEIKPK